MQHNNEIGGDSVAAAAYPVLVLDFQTLLYRTINLSTSYIVLCFLTIWNALESFRSTTLFPVGRGPP